MGNSSNTVNRQEDTPEANGHISMDAHIILTVLASMIVVAIILMVLHVQDNEGIKSVANGLSIIVSFYCVAIAWRRSFTAQGGIQKRSVVMSSALGSLLPGLFSFVFADFDSHMLLVVIMAMCFVFAALSIIGIIVLLFQGEKVEQPSKQASKPSGLANMQSANDHRNFPPRRIQKGGPDPINLQPLHPPEYASQVNPPPTQTQMQAMYQQANSPPHSDESINTSPPPLPISAPTMYGQLNIMPSPTSKLRSLFEGDELYDIPRNTKAQLFISTKSNDILENCEDACAISDEKKCFALCDGVSASNFARPWAKLLAERWVAQPLQEDDAEAVDKWLEEPRTHWKTWVSTTWLGKINERNRSLGRIEFTPADVKKLIIQGAAATFLGLMVDNATSTWTALSVGDTCLFHFFRNELNSWEYESFPYKSSAQFTDDPFSITSRNNTAPIVASNILRLNNQSYKAGDILVMATDALAEWLLRHLESKKINTVLALLERMNDESFTKFVEDQRAKKELKDDDTTLIIIHL